MTVVNTTFTYGLLFGIYLNTAAFANRWLIFVDEGWKLRKNVHWFLVVITNLIFAGETAIVGVLVNGAFVEARFVEIQGHQLSEYTEAPWIAIAAVSL